MQKKIHLAVPLGSLQRSPDSQLYFRGGISAGWVREWEKRGWGLMPSALILNLCNHNRWTVLMNNSIDDDYIATGLERRAAEWLMHQWRQDAGSLVTTSLSRRRLLEQQQQLLLLATRAALPDSASVEHARSATPLTCVDLSSAVT